MKKGKWQISRKEYKGKNILGERIYHIWKVKVVKTKIAGFDGEVVVDEKKEVVAVK